VPQQDILLEEEAYSTQENATNAARVLHRAGFEPLAAKLARDLARIEALSQGAGGEANGGRGRGPPGRGGKGGKAGKGGKGLKALGFAKGGKGLAPPKESLHEVILVSNSVHVEWAAPLFLAEPFFAKGPLRKSGVEVWAEELEAQLLEYLERGEEGAMWAVKERLRCLREGTQGVDALVYRSSPAGGAG